MELSKLFDVKDKIVLVTGGGRGIGEMIATGFVSNGAKVYISSRSAKVCEEVATRLSKQGPGQCISIPADLQSPEGVNCLAEELKNREDHLDVLVNNAAIYNSQDFDSYTEAKWDELMDVNLKAPYFLTKALIPLLTAKSTPQDPSRVIMIGSIAAWVNSSVPNYPYSVSKAGLHRMTEALAPLLGPRNITVNTVSPGFFRTDMTKDFLSQFSEPVLNEFIKNVIPSGRTGTTEDIAGTCIYLASRAGAYTNGATIVVDGCLAHSNVGMIRLFQALNLTKSVMSGPSALGVELLFTSGSFMTQAVLYKNIRSREFLLLTIAQLVILSEQIQYHTMKFNLQNKNALTISTSIFWSACFAITNYVRDEYAIMLSISDVLSGLIMTIYEVISLHIIGNTLTLGLYDMVMFGKKEFEKATDLNEMNLSIKLISYMIYYNISLSVKYSKSEYSSNGLSFSFPEDYNPALHQSAYQHFDHLCKSDTQNELQSAHAGRSNSVHITVPAKAHNTSDKHQCANCV
ncbi:uncharacterized protein VTP21DRAFT_9085 [Calcarisporiella thermophila]|uniref:uncharacterized protein n=1 Tax=Calcarisporiella thermophila TaxID=911321 RepID=UPI0037434230